jgi:hypothetical protein
MEIHSYNQELAIASTQFKRFFNNISVVRDGQEVPFQCVIGNRSRIFKGLENPNKNGMYSLPMIIIQRTGITKNNDRLTNVNNEVKYASHSGRLNYNLYTPVPIDISFQVTIVSKRQGDIDKALSNFIPFFNKDAFVRYKHPKFDGLFMKCQVIMDDTITEEHPESLDALDYDVVTCTCNFTFKTWIFCGNDVVSSADNRIRHIVSVYTDVDEDGLSNEVSVVTDTEYIGFIPSIRQINVGFYPVPIISGFLSHMDWVDSLWLSGYDDHPYVDRFIWKIDESGYITGQVGNSYHYPPYSSAPLSGYYDERRVSCDSFISGQLSTYSYLSGPDEDHKPWGPPITSSDPV